jgi:hypothetical protein
MKLSGSASPGRGRRTTPRPYLRTHPHARIYGQIWRIRTRWRCAGVRVCASAWVDKVALQARRRTAARVPGLSIQTFQKRSSSTTPAYTSTRSTFLRPATRLYLRSSAFHRGLGGRRGHGGGGILAGPRLGPPKRADPWPVALRPLPAIPSHPQPGGAPEPLTRSRVHDKRADVCSRLSPPLYQEMAFHCSRILCNGDFFL